MTIAEKAFNHSQLRKQKRRKKEIDALARKKRRAEYSLNYYYNHRETVLAKSRAKSREKKRKMQEKADKELMEFKQFMDSQRPPVKASDIMNTPMGGRLVKLLNRAVGDDQYLIIPRG